MKIIFRKLNTSTHELRITRNGTVSESINFNTNIYLIHDVCHFVVEKELKTLDGFWGMLSRGYKIEQLSGKWNLLTEKLRLIECIVGATQSVYLKRMSQVDFWNYIGTTDCDLQDQCFLDSVIPKIKDIMGKWKYLPTGEQVSLEF